MPYSLWVLSPLIFLQMTHTSLFTDSHYHIFLMKYLWNGVVISIYTEITVPWWIYLMTKSYTMTGISSDSILIAIPTCFFLFFPTNHFPFPSGIEVSFEMKEEMGVFICSTCIKNDHWYSISSMDLVLYAQYPFTAWLYQPVIYPLV